MNHFIGVVGIDPEVPLRFAVNHLQKSTRWHKCRFKPSLKYPNFAGGFLMKDENAATASVLPDMQPIMLASRKSVSAFLACNEPFGKTLRGADTPDGLASAIAEQQLVAEQATAFCGGLALSMSGTSEQAKTRLRFLKGDFRLLAVTPKTRSISLAVSPFNPQTFFYMQIPKFKGCYVISTCIDFLLATVTPKVDTTSLALWLSGRPDAHRSMYANIHQVKPGTLLVITRKGEISTETFWDINPKDKIVGQAAKDAATTLRALISESVQSHIAYTLPNDAVFTQMSGGMDSTSVTALTHECMASSATLNADPDASPDAITPMLHTVSHTYVNTEGCDETDNIQAMIRQFTCAENHFIELDKYTEMDFSTLYPTHVQSPGMVLSPKYYEEAKLLKSHNAKLLLTGNGGDEMFWGHSFSYYDRVKKADTSAISDVIKGAIALKMPVLKTLRSVFARPLIKYDLMCLFNQAERITKMRNNTPLPAWITPGARAVVSTANTKESNVFAEKGADFGKFARYEGMFNTTTFNSMRSYQAVFDEFDIQVEHPLLTANIAQFTFAVAQKKLLNGTYPKFLLRQAMTNDLPEQVCWNQQKTVFDQHFAKLVQQNAVSIRLLLQHTALADMGLIDNKVLLAAFDNLVSSSQPSINLDLLYAILVQSWYQTHIVPLQLAPVKIQPAVAAPVDADKSATKL
jgi:asparagine synthase (glutamine-hydrolysing)